MENKSIIQLNELAAKIHQNAVDKGFWDESREIGTSLMLVVSELGEAIDADQNGRYATIDSEDLIIDGKTIRQDLDEYYTKNIIDFEIIFKQQVKDTFEDEIADAIIRLLDLCAHMKIDIQKHIELKMKYNETRERLHGKKY